MASAELHVGDGIHVSEDSLYLFKSLANPALVDLSQPERKDVENAPSIIREDLRRSSGGLSSLPGRQERQREERRDGPISRRLATIQEDEERRSGERDDRRGGSLRDRDERLRDRDEASRNRREREGDVLKYSGRDGRDGRDLKNDRSRSDEIIRGRSGRNREESIFERAVRQSREKSREMDRPTERSTERPHQPSNPSPSRPTQKPGDIPLPSLPADPEAHTSSRRSDSVFARKLDEARRERSHERSDRPRDERPRERHRDDYRRERDRDRGDDYRRSGDRDRGDDYRRDRDRDRDRRDDYRRDDYRRERRRERRSGAEEHEKRDYLMGLEKLKLQGIRITKDYTMDDSLTDIQYEFDRHNMNLESLQKVETSKSYIRIAAVVVIVINHFIGKKLALGGWLEKLNSELENPKYFLPLEEMYRSMHRRGPPSPWFSLALMFISSMIFTHFDNKLNISGGGGNTPSQAPTAGTQSGGGGGGIGGLMGSLGGLGGIMGMMGNLFGGQSKSGPRPVNLDQTTKVPPPPPTSRPPPSTSAPPPGGFRKPLSPPR